MAGRGPRAASTRRATTLRSPDEDGRSRGARAGLDARGPQPLRRPPLRRPDGLAPARARLPGPGGRGARILDDRSLNGVFVNGERVELAELDDGDEIAVGRFTLFFLRAHEEPGGAAGSPARGTALATLAEPPAPARRIGGMWSHAAAALASAALLGPPPSRPRDASPTGGLPHGRLSSACTRPSGSRCSTWPTGATVPGRRRLPGGTLCHGPLMVSGAGVPLVRRDVSRTCAPRAQAPLGARGRTADGRAVAVRGSPARGGSCSARAGAPPAGYPSGGGAGGLVFEHRGRRRIWDPRSGALRPAGGEWLVGASEHGSAWCDGRCRAAAHPRRRPFAGRCSARGSSFLPGSGRSRPTVPAGGGARPAPAAGGSRSWHPHAAR